MTVMLTGAVEPTRMLKRTVDGPAFAFWTVKPSNSTSPAVAVMRTVPAMARPVPPVPSMIVAAAPATLWTVSAF